VKRIVKRVVERVVKRVVKRRRRLLIPQGTHRICHRRSECLSCYGCQSYREGDHSGFQEYGRPDRDSVGETSEPVTHYPPAEGDCNEDSDGNQLNKVF
jgi:hypothetical protein